jgi:hypothetical protein
MTVDDTNTVRLGPGNGMAGPAVLLAGQSLSRREANGKVHAMPETFKTTVAVIGIDIGKNSFLRRWAGLGKVQVYDLSREPNRVARTRITTVHCGSSAQSGCCRNRARFSRRRNSAKTLFSARIELNF